MCDRGRARLGLTTQPSLCTIAPATPRMSARSIACPASWTTARPWRSVRLSAWDLRLTSCVSLSLARPLNRQGRDENRTLKGLDIPSGAEVQLVLERASAERSAFANTLSRRGRQSARYGERELALLGARSLVSYCLMSQPGSFRTATYVCRGTVFNPHLEMDFPKRPTLDDKRPAYDEKTMLIAPQPATVEPRPPVSPRCSFLCCL